MCEAAPFKHSMKNKDLNMDETSVGSHISNSHMGLSWQTKECVDFESFGLGFWIIKLTVF